MLHAEHFQFNIRHLFYGIAGVVVFLGLGTPGKSVFLMLLPIILLYWSRWLGTRWVPKSRSRILLHFGVCILTLPYIYLLSPYQPSPSASPLSLWIGAPVLTFFVPTVSILIDEIGENTYDDVWIYSVKSALEILILVPLWFFVWIVIEMEVLNWIWI